MVTSSPQDFSGRGYPPEDRSAAKRQPRLLNLELLRAAAALAVVIYHTVGGLMLKGLELGYLTFFYPLGAAGVDVFFVISGFVIYLNVFESKQPAVPFFKKRIRRIVPAYWIATLLTVVFIVSYGYLAQRFGLENSLEPLNFSRFFSSLFFVSGITGNGLPIVGQGWTLE